VKNKVRYYYAGRPLTEEDIRKFAPSVMNEDGPSDNVTEKYSFFPTIELLRQLRTIGWIPYAVEQRVSYTGATRRGLKPSELKNRQEKALTRMHFNKHMVVLQNPTIPPVEDLKPEIVVTNSHDGRNSFQFFAGLFHVTKHTSFVISDPSFGELEDFRVKHQGYDFSQVIKVIDKVMDVIPEIYEKVATMRDTVLTPNKKLAFAFEAVRLRWKEMERSRIDLEEVIAAIREDEKDDNLWNLFQIIQEKLVNGGFKYDIKSVKVDKKTGKKKFVTRRQTARALENIDQKIEIKKSLWKIAAKITDAVRRTSSLKHEATHS
jgi:hypothetical protein